MRKIHACFLQYQLFFVATKPTKHDKILSRIRDIEELYLRILFFTYVFACENPLTASPSGDPEDAAEGLKLSLERSKIQNYNVPSNCEVAVVYANIMINFNTFAAGQLNLENKVQMGMAIVLTIASFGKWWRTVESQAGGR